MALISPHGSKELLPKLIKEEFRKEMKKKAESLKKIPITSRESGDLIMIGNGGFTPLRGFMGYDDWKGCVKEMALSSYKNLFWPIPITLSISEEMAKSLSKGEEASLYDAETDEVLAIIKVDEKYKIDKKEECREVFKTVDEKHPGVKMVMNQREFNIGGEVQVLSESYFPEKFKGLYHTPFDSRKMFEERGWQKVAALQLRNPMHNSHAYLAWIAIEVCDGVYIHQLVGNLKPGDIPADVRVKAINVLIDKYFRKERVAVGGYPLDMRYAGPKEALLHALFRQNYGCSHLIVGRDHAGVGDYYGPFDAQKIFDEIPDDALKIKPLPLDWTFYCYECGSMASMKTCPHETIAKIDENGNYQGGARLMLSGTLLRKLMSEGKPVPKEFSKPEVIEVLKDYYDNLEKKEKIELHSKANPQLKK